MQQDSTLFGMGAKILEGVDAESVDLGPLNNLNGTWIGKPFDGWNVIAVPGPQNQNGFTLEVIPYEEKLTFNPVVVAGNRGTFVNGVEQDQSIAGLMYEQIVTSVCDTQFCSDRGFAPGTIIHGETGLMLNVKNFNGGFDIVRLSTIPHGNSVLAMGQSFTGVPPNNDFFGKASTMPTTINGGPPPLGYAETQYFKEQFPDFNQLDPNTFLQKTLGNQKMSAMTTLVFSTENQDGGILNIPFIQQNVKTTKMHSIFWIESMIGSTGEADTLQMQYTQTIELVFPATGTTLPIVWPHVTINTLTKTA